MIARSARIYHNQRTRLGVVLSGLIALCSCASTDEAAVSDAVKQVGDANDLLVVDCLLPGQLRKLGSQLNYLTQRRAIKTPAVDCEIRGGEYVAYDRSNYATSLKVWLPLAKEGDPAAQTYVGEIYEKGLGVLSDYPTALQWYVKAAQQNYSRAQINIGYLYESGLGVERNLVEAMNWYRKASGLSGGELEYVSSVEAARRVSAAAETEQLRTEVTALRSETSRMQTELSERRAQLRAAEADSARLEKELQAKRQVVAVPVAGESADALKRELDRVAAERQQLITALAEQQSTLDRLRNDLQQGERSLAASNRDVEALQAELGSTREALDRSKRAAEGNEAASAIEVVRLQSLVDGLENEIGQQQATITSLESANRDTRRELQAATSAAGDADTQLRARLQDKDQQLTRLRLQMVERESAMSQLEGELARTRGDQTRLDAELQQQRSEVDRLRAELGDSIREVEKRRLELGKTRQELDSAKRALSRQQQASDEAGKSQATAWSARVVELEDSLKLQQGEIGRLENQARLREGQLNEELARVQEKQKELELAVNTRDQEIKSLQSQLEISQQALAAQGSASVTAIAALETELRNRQDEIARQKQEIEQLQAKTAGTAAVEAATVSRVAEFAAVEIPVAVGPSIEIIEPPIALTRGTPTVRLRSAVTEIEVIGRVTPASELLSFRINDQVENVDRRGLFQTLIQLQSKDAPVHAVAVDKYGQRTMLDFVIQPAGEVKAQPLARERQPEVAQVSGVSLGTYHALVIGNNQYENLPNLRTARSDASAVAEVLERRYGFKTTLLLDADRYAILSELNRLRRELDENSNLLIYYAGHGELDGKNLRGYWLPVDSEQDSSTNWISNVAITDILNVMAARHILVVADSCYSGTMTRSSVARLETGMTSDQKRQWYEAMSNVRARLVLSSGGVQPVLDSSGGNHSVFAGAFLEALRTNQGILEGFALYRSVQASVKSDAASAQIDQNPQYSPIKFAGHEAGEFLFPPVRGGSALLDLTRNRLAVQAEQ